MIALIDTDVLIDVALDRKPHSEASGEFLALCARRSIRAFVAWHSLANFHYLLRPGPGSPSPKDFLLDLLAFAEVAPASTQSARYAAGLAMRDFEDALQAAAAVACGADVIATRNLRDYARSPVRAASPAALVKELAPRQPRTRLQ